MEHKRTLPFLVLGVALLLIPTAALAAPGCGGDAVTVSPQKMSRIWSKTLEGFAQTHNELSVAQLGLIFEAIDSIKPAAFEGRPVDLEALRRVTARLEESLSLTHRGQIFSRMGVGQAFLMQIGALATPYCDCTPLGATCTTHPGTCKTGCITWEQNTKGDADQDQEVGTAYVGVCSS